MSDPDLFKHLYEDRPSPKDNPERTDTGELYQIVYSPGVPVSSFSRADRQDTGIRHQSWWVRVSPVLAAVGVIAGLVALLVIAVSLASWAGTVWLERAW
jgi:hypothetical protein